MDAKTFGRGNVRSVASPYLKLYVYNGQFLDTQYGIRKDGIHLRLAIPRF